MGAGLLGRRSVQRAACVARAGATARRPGRPRRPRRSRHAARSPPRGVMQALRIAIGAIVVGTAFCLLNDWSWRAACLGALFGLLLAAMAETMPLVDWIYPS